MNHPITKKEWNYWHARVYGYFFKRVRHREDVEDLTSETMNQYFLHHYQEKQPGLMWVIARRSYADFIAKKQAEGISLEDLEIESNSSPYYKAKIDDLLNCIQKYVQGTDWLIIKLILLENKYSHEISDELMLKPAAIRKRLSRSLKKVRKACLNVWLPDACNS